MTPAAVRRRARGIRGLACDVDGVLTDGGLYVGPAGEAMKRFHVRDGMGLRLLREAGYALALISGEDGDAIRRRAEKLRIGHVYLGVEDKAAAFADFAARAGLKAEELAYAGDDVNDLPPMRAAGLAAAVPGAAAEVRRAAHLVLKTPGGQGAVRELCELLLAARRGSR